MSYFDDASLVMIPSGYKEDKVYSVKPIDGSGDLDFTRASSATRIGPTGLIEKTRTNLLLQSNSFNTTWTTSNVTLTSGQSGYNGTSNAWKLLSNSSSSESYVRQTTTLTGVGSVSVYAKAGNVNFLGIYIGSTAVDVYSFFNLSTGSVGTKSNTIDAKIESVGSGWYRCSVTGNDLDQNINLYVTDADGNFLSTNGNFIYIQDSQVEQGLVATSYIDTTTTAVTVGSYDNVPRLNYTAGSTSSCPSLLLEPQRTNIITQSEYFDSYTQFGSDITQNSLTSPEGVTNASTFIGDGSQTQIFLSTVITLASGGNATVSVFAKTGTNNFLEIGFDGFSTSTLSVGVFNLTSGTATGTGTSMESYGNGWYRCILTQDIDSGDLAGAISMRVRPESSLFWPSASDANGKSVYLYGAQVEAGSYATSYIPTFGATVTRVVDACSKTGISGLISQTEGTLFVEFKTDNRTTDARRFSISDNTTNNRINIYASGNNISGFIGGTSTTFSTPLALGQFTKVAFKYKSGSNAFYVNGTQIGTSADTFTLSGMNRFGFDLVSNVNLFFGDIKKVLYFPTTLSDTQLAELTS